ncbi:ferrochelatase [Talaromyces islandicus]|uniref:Ferrochelatase, mitochondrial n=1 Tax=Talaromyces islandicus TaxID=28573 RepID=A0A0U1LUX6_TALIS|nr:ferrochelatase [Talaromyces islandicus]
MQWFMLIFHESSFRETAERLISRQVWSRQELSSVISVLAVGLIGLQSVLPDRKWSGHELLQTYGLDAHKLLKEFLAEIRLRFVDILEDCRIEGVQSCILVSSYYVFHNSPSLAWTMFGMAMRIAYALDMQIRPSRKFLIADEIRSRCWNSIIVSDTFSSVVYGRPISIDTAFASLHPLEFSDDLKIHPWLLKHPLVADANHGITSMVPFHVLKTEIYSLNRDIILRFRRLPLKAESGVGEVDLMAIAQIAQEADEVLTHWRRRLPKLFDFEYWTSDGKWDQIERELMNTSSHAIQGQVEIIYFQAAILQLTYDAAVIQTQRPVLEQRFHNSTCSASVLDAMHKSLGIATEAALRISRIPVHKLNNHFAASFASVQQFTAGVILCIQPTSQPFTTASHEAKEGVMRIIHSSRGFSHYNRIAKQTDELLTELLKVTIERETSRALRETRPSSPDRGTAVDDRTVGVQLTEGSSEIESSVPNIAGRLDPMDQAIQSQSPSETEMLASGFNGPAGAQPFGFPSAHIFEHLDSIFGAFGDPPRRRVLLRRFGLGLGRVSFELDTILLGKEKTEAYSTMALRNPSALPTRILSHSTARPTVRAFGCQWSQKHGLATATSAPAKGSKGPTAMVFLNMGGPSKTDHVEDFLSRLFADGDLIPLGPLQKYIGPLLARRRTPKIQKQYADIGGGSPIRKWSEHQCEEMCKLLDEISPETAPHKPYVAFRYAAPLTEEMYNRLLDDGFGRGNGGRAVAFTQYPQYSCSTTGSSLNELWKWRNRLEGPRSGQDPAGAIQWSVIDRWPTHPGLVEAFAKLIEDQLATYPEDKRSSVLLLFSAHSLPMSVVNRGDPYTAEVAATVHAVMQRLGFTNPYRLCWQSQVGPSAWQGAQTSHTVENYVKKGFTDMVLVPIAFTSDHIETLYELDREVIHDAGHPGVKRAESLNGNRTFIEALADIASTHLKSGQACSKQMTLRCQGCTSERLGLDKDETWYKALAISSFILIVESYLTPPKTKHTPFAPESQAPFAIDPDEDARVRYQGRTTIDDLGIAETAPLLAGTSPEPLPNEPAGADDHERPWLGSDEFSRKPPWRRPSVLWILSPLFLFTLAFGGIVVPRIELILNLVCRDYFAKQASQEPNFTYLPIVFGKNNDQCNIPAVSAGTSQFMLYLSLISGLLSAIVSPRLGDLSDRYGRTLLLALCIFGTLVMEAVTTFVATNYETISINWLLVGAFADGLCGSFTSAIALAHSYGADCSSPERRNVIFGLFHATLFSGIALGPFLFGLFIKLTGSILAVFYTVMCFHLLPFLLLLFVIPESVSKERQKVAKEKYRKKQSESDSTVLQSFLRDINPVNIFKPLAILFPTPDKDQPYTLAQRAMFRPLRKNLFLLASIDTLMFGVAMGTMQIIVIYAKFMFQWDDYESSIFVSVTNTGRVITLLVIFPTITRYLRGPQQTVQTNSGSDWLDIASIRLAILFELAGYTGYSLASTGGVFLFSAVIASIGGIGSPALQSSITKHVPASRTGQILGAMGLLHALARVVSPIIFNLIYTATVGKFTQTVFVCLASVFGVSAILSWFIAPGIHLPVTSASSQRPGSTENDTAED